jgi:hypothetical protein
MSHLTFHLNQTLLSSHFLSLIHSVLCLGQTPQQLTIPGESGICPNLGSWLISNTFMTASTCQSPNPAFNPSWSDTFLISTLPPENSLCATLCFLSYKTFLYCSFFISCPLLYLLFFVLSLILFIYFIIHLFTCVYIVWVISPPCPPLPPLLPLSPSLPLFLLY